MVLEQGTSTLKQGPTCIGMTSSEVQLEKVGIFVFQLKTTVNSSLKR